MSQFASQELPTAAEPVEPPQTFASEADRQRLTPTSLKAFRRLCAIWGLDNGAAAALLGVSLSTWDRIKAGRWDGVLSQDQMTRVSAIIGIYKGLHLLFADDTADIWPVRPNRNPLFDRLAPVEAMIRGGIPHMIDTRRYVDALRGGL
jgi:hypothetical protein